MHQQKPLRSAATLTAMLTAGALLTACSGTSAPAGSESAEGSETVSLAVFNQYPPAEYVKDGELTGWMIDLLDPISEISGLEFEITQVSNFSTIIPGLQSGRFDVAAANITVTNERMETLDFVTIDTVGTGFATASDDNATISEPTDVCGMTVSALTGSVYEPQMVSINEECSTEGLEPATVSLFPDTGAAILAVQNGRTDAVIGSYAEIANAVNESDGLELQPYQFGQLPEAIGFPKDSPYTQRILDAVNELIENGTYAEILDEYGVPGIAIEKSELNPTVD